MIGILWQRALDKIQRWYIEGLIGRALSDSEWEQLRKGKQFWL